MGISSPRVSLGWWIERGQQARPALVGWRATSVIVAPFWGKANVGPNAITPLLRLPKASLRQPSSPCFGKMLLRFFSGRRPADVRALVGICEHAGERPAPAVPERAASLFSEPITVSPHAMTRL